MDERDELRLGCETAYIDGSVASNSLYCPQFITNNYKSGKKVLSTIENELLKCDKFQISVAFITMGGITPLLQTLKELEKKNIPGEILTTNYLDFSEPKALKKLNGLSNITLKMYDVKAADEGFHTKGYIFRTGEVYQIIIGSSNMTSTALTSNQEWNTRIISTEQGKMAEEIISEFDHLWNSQHTFGFDDFYENYKEEYNIVKHQRDIATQEKIVSLEKYNLKPNSMQIAFITNLKKIIDAGKNRALLISATGTGKTYASAFAMRELGFKRVLFLVHRGQLARQTKKSYERVFEKSVSMGLVCGGYREYNADYVFATVQTLNRDEHLLQYNKNAFDCIILDEAHHVTADTYQKIICRTNRTYDDGKTHGLIVDYIGIFDNVAKALDFDEAGMKKVITNIEEVKKQVPALMRKCLSYFMGVDRTIEGWEGLIAAQECLPTNKEKDQFGADYRVLNKAWNALSPDPILNTYSFDYQWLSRVYESVKPTDGRGGLIWAALGAKTMELVHQNLEVGDVHEDEEIISLDATLIDQFIEKQKDIKKTTMKVEIDLVAKIQKHGHEEKFVKLGQKLEDLRERHEQGLINSIEFLKLLLQLAKEAAQAEKEVVPEEEIDKGKAALTELFNGVRNEKTPIMVERIVNDIDDIVKIVRFDGWQDTNTGRNEVKKALRSVVWIKYKIKDKEVFDRAYSYIEQYY